MPRPSQGPLPPIGCAEQARSGDGHLPARSRAKHSMSARRAADDAVADDRDTLRHRHKGQCDIPLAPPDLPDWRQMRMVRATGMVLEK
jgi:hypothetical protein